MITTFTEKKRIRKNYGSEAASLGIPYLLELQKDSYADFLQEGGGEKKRDHAGLELAFRSVFPIRGTAGSAILDYVYYRTEKPEYSIEECRQRGLSFSVPVYVKLKLHLLDKEKGSKTKPAPVKETKEEEVFIGDVPKMTENGTFVINGTERVVVSQLHRSPGVIFSHDKGKSHSSQKILFNARIIPYRGSWLDFEFDHHDILYARIDRHRKFYVTALLHAMGLDNEQILKTFFDHQKFIFQKSGVQVVFSAEHFRGVRVDFDILSAGQVIVSKGSMINAGHIKKMVDEKITKIAIPKDYTVGRISAKNIVDKDGTVIVEANGIITESIVDRLCETGQKMVPLLYVDDVTRGAYLSETMRLDSTTDKASAQIEIYRMIRPGEPPTTESARKLFEEALFFDESRYNLSAVGRMKFNRRLKKKKDIGENVLSNEDILDVLKEIISIKDGHGYVDDIDTLANRRVKAVGELTANSCRTGLARVERVVRERLNQAELEGWMPKDLINPKPVTGAIREFFG